MPRSRIDPRVTRETYERVCKYLASRRKPGVPITYKELVSALGMPNTTMRDHLGREGITSSSMLQELSTDPEIIMGDGPNRPPDPAEGVKDFYNLREFSAQSVPHITTIEQLVSHNKIDEENWSIIKQEPRKWDVALKHKHIDGTTSSELIQLFYVAVTALPKKPIAFSPQVQPILTSHSIPAAPKTELAEGRCMVIQDAQIGFIRDTLTGTLTPIHDRDALEAAVQFAAEIQPDILVLAGDMLDMTMWTNHFPRQPEFYFTTQPAIFEAHYWMWRFAKALGKKTRKIMLAGNHEERWRSALGQNLLELYKLFAVQDHVAISPMTLKFFLDAESLGYEWVEDYPDGEVAIGPVRVLHGNKARATPGATGVAMLAGSSVPLAIGHIHRTELVTKVTTDLHGNPQMIWSACFGCLCHIDYRVPGHQKGQTWNQGWGMIEWSGNHAQPTPIMLEKGRAIYNGKVYQGKFDVESLNKMMQDLLPDIPYRFSV